jgi:sterol 24-C-methyltransferase
VTGGIVLLGILFEETEPVENDPTERTSRRLRKAPLGMSRPIITELIQNSLPRDEVGGAAAEYAAFHAGTVDERKSNYARMVNNYYDLATDFYEYGWGQSFHFAPRYRSESFEASIARHEHFLAAQLGLRPGMTAVDLGCGVGGPMRAIARFSGASILGVNNNDYQIKRGERHTRDAGLSSRCRFLKADFMALPLEDASVDAAYVIEAACHAPDKLALFKEVARVLKPGARFAGYEWCLTGRYDPTNAEHRAIKKGIEEGDALPDIWPTDDVVSALAGAGLEVIEGRDVALDSSPETPWYLPLAGQWSLTGFKRTPPGRWLTNHLVRALEWARIAPRGSTAVSSFLNVGADALVRGGETGIFTPMFFFHARKPG